MAAGAAAGAAAAAAVGAAACGKGPPSTTGVAHIQREQAAQRAHDCGKGQNYHGRLRSCCGTRRKFLTFQRECVIVRPKIYQKGFVRRTVPW